MSVSADVHVFVFVSVYAHVSMLLSMAVSVPVTVSMLVLSTFASCGYIRVFVCLGVHVFRSVCTCACASG